MTTRYFCNICDEPAPKTGSRSRSLKFEQRAEDGGPVIGRWEAEIHIRMSWPDDKRSDAHLCDTCFWRIVTAHAPEAP